MMLPLRCMLIVVCLGLSAVSTRAMADEEGTSATTVPDVEQATAEEDREGGIFSSILKWFSGRKADAPIEPPQEPTPVVERGDISPSHVYQAAADLLAEIRILRRATGITSEPPNSIVPVYQSLIHANSKATEVLEKTVRLQKRLGMIPAEVEQVAIGNLTARDLQRRIFDIVGELRRVKRQLVVDEEIEPSPFLGSKTLSLVYQRLADASILLDDLIGRPTTPNDVYIRVLQIHDEMELVADELGVTLKYEPPSVDVDKEFKDLAQQILRASYKVISLQTMLGMEAASASFMTLERVTPAQVYDAATTLLVEMVRIKEHLRIERPPQARRESRDKPPREVFAQILLVIDNLDVMIDGAEVAR